MNADMNGVLIMNELDKAFYDFMDAIAKELHIYELLDWLVKIMK